MEKPYVLLALLFGICVFQSCDENDEWAHPKDKEVETAFNEMYPGATRMEWETKQGYWVVDFWENSKEVEAWFSPGGEWYQTETDITYAELPQAVQTAFESGDYKDWRVDDVDKMERKDEGTFYILDVEKAANPDYDLYYTADGTLIKAKVDK